MAAAEVNVTKVAGEFPYGPPPPNEVAFASGMARALVRYKLAIREGQTVPPPGAIWRDLEEAQTIAQARFTRAVLGSMRVTRPPIEGRNVELTPSDLDATGATNSVAEAQQLYDKRMAEIDYYSEKAPYGVQHERVLEAALVYAAESAGQEWEIREVQEVAASRGYTGVLALVATILPDTPVTIDEYARTA